ncbi:hypothetical protein WR25_12364 [Diploscapter pachys]|uniref:Uncharacterized protein n=1 Tax=Diploscapter pachys TaxID=2018661 RepID=A0A2A2J9V9_9BILA|nr:hypothetical protein WR25_12364 [Diploscapter pachys]
MTIQCPLCSTSQTSEEVLENHISLEHPEWCLFSCSFSNCEVVRFTKKQMEMHIWAAHGQRAVPVCYCRDQLMEEEIGREMERARKSSNKPIPEQQQQAEESNENDDVSINATNEAGEDGVQMILDELIRNEKRKNDEIETEMETRLKRRKIEEEGEKHPESPADPLFSTADAKPQPKGVKMMWKIANLDELSLSKGVNFKLLNGCFLTVNLVPSPLTDAFVSLMTGSNNFGVDGAPLSFVGVTSKHPEERLVGGHFVLDIPQGSSLLDKTKSQSKLSNNIMHRNCGDVFINVTYPEKFQIYIWRSKKNPAQMNFVKVGRISDFPPMFLFHSFRNALFQITKTKIIY